MVEHLVMGPIDNNVYIVETGDGTVAVVDPTCDAPRIMRAVGDRTVEAIVLTHCHWDHVGAAAALRELTGARVIASSTDAVFITGEQLYDGGRMPVEPCPVDLAVDDGDVVEIGTSKWQVIATPGHTKGSVCFFVETDAAPVLISGDTLFAGTHGRTDFEGGSISEMRDSLARLAQLPDDTIVYPGHNGFSTIGREKSWLPR